MPDLSKHLVIHAYQKGELVRAITLGMEKFGLPDLVIDQSSRSLQAQHRTCHESVRQACREL